MPSVAALKAIGFFGRILSLWKRLRTKILKKSIKLKKYLRDIVRLEEGPGANTEFFSKVKAALDTEKGIGNLTYEDLVYFWEWYQLWVKYVKKPLGIVADIMDTSDDSDDDEDDN
jgi:hypothetical protein